MGSLARPFKDLMSPLKIAGIVLVVAGALALAYGGFSYTRDSHETQLGPFKFSLQQKERVNVPQWGGLGAIAIGVVLLVIGKRK